ncbi:Uncharacterized protein APZ42_021960, partial [Daphnia magna]
MSIAPFTPLECHVNLSQKWMMWDHSSVQGCCEDLSVDSGLVLFSGCRIAIPSTVHRVVSRKLHASLQDIVRTKCRERQMVYWIKMANEFILLDTVHTEIKSSKSCENYEALTAHFICNYVVFRLAMLGIEKLDNQTADGHMELVEKLVNKHVGLMKRVATLKP